MASVAILDKTIEWSLYILVFSIPFSKSIIEISITIAFIAWLFKKILMRDLTLKKTPLNTALFAFFVISAISIINADFKLLAMRPLVSKCLKYIILYFIVVETVDSEIKFKNLLKMALVSATVVMIDAYIQRFLVHWDLFRLYPSFKFAPITDWDGKHPGFPTGPFPFPNDLSAWMLIILMPALSVYIWGSKRAGTKVFLGSFLFPFLFLFYLANTRSAWLGFFISFFLGLFIRNKKIFIVSMAIFLLIAAITLILLPRDKTVDIFGFSSMQDRFYMWRIGWRIFSEHPIIGNGINTFFLKFKEYREDEYKYLKGSYAHNGYLQMACEIGTVGLAIFLVLVGRGIRTAFASAESGNEDTFYRAFTLGLAGGLLAFLIHSFFDTNLQSLPLVTLFWFSLAFLMSAQRIYAREI